MPLPNETQRKALQVVVNQALTLDPLASKRIKSLSGKRFQIDCSDPELSILISIKNDEVELLAADENPVDTHITGDLSAYTKLLGSEDKAAAIINSGLKVKGDSQNLLTLQEILANTNLDWEYHIANLIGDVPAHLIGRASREALSWLKSTRPVFERHLKEFILEEARLSPTKTEMEALISDIHTLKEKTERLEAHINKLKEKKGLVE